MTLHNKQIKNLSLERDEGKSESFGLYSFFVP